MSPGLHPQPPPPPGEQKNTAAPPEGVSAPRPKPTGTAGPVSAPGAPLRRPLMPEPPAFRAHPLGAAGACVDCGTSIAPGGAVPRCWECSRPLCGDCFWRHGMNPADHRCAACQAHGGGAAFSVSGGRTTVRSP